MLNLQLLSARQAAPRLSLLTRCSCSTRLQRSIHSSSSQLAEPSLSERLAARYATRNAPSSTELKPTPAPIPPRSKIEELILASLSPSSLSPPPKPNKSPTPTSPRPSPAPKPLRRGGPHDGASRSLPGGEKPQDEQSLRRQVEVDRQTQATRERQSRVMREQHKAKMRRVEEIHVREVKEQEEVARAKERREQPQPPRQPRKIVAKAPETSEERGAAAMRLWVGARMVDARAEWRRRRVEELGGNFTSRQLKTRWRQPKLLALEEEWDALHPRQDFATPVSDEERAAKVEWTRVKHLGLEAEWAGILTREGTTKSNFLLQEQRKFEKEWIEEEKDAWSEADDLLQVELFMGTSSNALDGDQDAVLEEDLKNRVRPNQAERAALNRVDRRKADESVAGLEGGYQSAQLTVKLNYDNPNEQERRKAKQIKRYRDLQEERRHMEPELAARQELLLPPWDMLSARKMQALALRSEAKASLTQIRQGTSLLKRDRRSSSSSNELPSSTDSTSSVIAPSPVDSASSLDHSIDTPSSAAVSPPTPDPTSSIATPSNATPTPSTGSPNPDVPSKLGPTHSAEARSSMKIVEEVRAKYEQRRLASREVFRVKWGDDALARADAAILAMPPPGPTPKVQKSPELPAADSASLKKAGTAKGQDSTKDAPPHISLASSSTSLPPSSPSSSTSASNRRPPTPPLPPLSSYPSVLSSTSTTLTPFVPSSPPIPIARLSHGLDRVLFNPGVHLLRDPRSGVYNFPTVLENLPKVDEFAFDKLPQYITSSKDERLMEIAKGQGRTFVSSTSSTVGMLCQIYFWLSKGREVNTSMLSAEWQTQDAGFSMGQRLPASVVMHFADGRYAVDADKSMDHGIETNILATYGHMMEKLLTTEPEEFSRFLVDSSDPAPSEADNRQAYHYTMSDHMVLRSQLDAHNEHLPNRTFDVKTRGSVAIRQDRMNYVESAGYTIDRLRGPFHSYEREYYDLIRSAFLKYSFQARIGAMDGCLIAYHSTARFFGFQYTPISEMEEAVYGDARLGDYVFKHCVGFLEKLLLEAKECYPAESLKLTFAADTTDDVLRVFVEPVLEDSSSPAVTLLELRGTNYIDGEAQAKVSLPSTFDKKGATWDVGYSIVKHTGLETGDLAMAGEEIARLLRDVRAFQSMFNNVTLPAGVKLADYLGAVERAGQEGLEQAEEDVALTKRFPVIPGFTYKGFPSRGVVNLRKLAAKGNAEAAQERAAQEGETRQVVQLKTVVETREE